jgi:tetratricopeptide (TPR) repeat protein
MILQLYTDDLETREELVDLYLQSGLFKESIHECTQIVLRVPDRISAHVTWGTALYKKSRFLKAGEKFLYAINNGSEDAFAYLYMVLIKVRSKNFAAHITEAETIRKILTHFKVKGIDARAGPFADSAA